LLYLFFILFRLGAVLRNPTQQNSTEADVEMTARNWLRLRRDRKQEGEHLKVK